MGKTTKISTSFFNLEANENNNINIDPKYIILQQQSSMFTNNLFVYYLRYS